MSFMYLASTHSWAQVEPGVVSMTADQRDETFECDTSNDLFI